jgi:hypothetical protein
MRNELRNELVRVVQEYEFKVYGVTFEGREFQVEYPSKHTKGSRVFYNLGERGDYVLTITEDGVVTLEEVSMMDIDEDKPMVAEFDTLKISDSLAKSLSFHIFMVNEEPMLFEDIRAKYKI